MSLKQSFHEIAEDFIAEDAFFNKASVKVHFKHLENELVNIYNGDKVDNKSTIAWRKPIILVGNDSFKKLYGLLNGCTI